MAESQDAVPDASTSKPSTGTGKVPISVYIMAIISGVFVTFGVMICVAFSHLFVGEWVPSAPRPVRTAIPLVAIGLGILSAWRSVAQAKRNAIETVKNKTSKPAG